MTSTQARIAVIVMTFWVDKNTQYKMLIQSNQLKAYPHYIQSPKNVLSNMTRQRRLQHSVTPDKPGQTKS